MHGKNHARGSATARNLFNHDRIGDVIESSAAFGFRQRNAGQPQFGSLCKQVSREMAGLVIFFRARLHFRFGKFANAFLQQ